MTNIFHMKQNSPILLKFMPNNNVNIINNRELKTNKNKTKYYDNRIE